MNKFLDDYDWECVFADEGNISGGNCDKTMQVVPPGADVSANGFSRGDVEKVIVAVNGENDGPDWVGLFLLNDGRFAIAEGGCDYTGWD